MSEINISNQKLTALPENLPDPVLGDFVFSYNDIAKLSGMPKKVTGSIYCHCNPGQFREADIRSVCDVGGQVYDGTYRVKPAWMTPKAEVSEAKEVKGKRK
jgi:hypothetical protein